MGISINDFIQMQARLNHNKLRDPQEPFEPAERETGKTGLQVEIMAWCDSQWPRWVYDFPRTDLKSTLPLGRHDATVWGPFPLCFLIETKAKGKKLSQDQQIWKTRMEAIGWKVHLVYSVDHFMKIVRSPFWEIAK